MASTSRVASVSFATPSQVSRPQAGPLPSKRGEIGFVEGVHEQLEVPSRDESLPERHPADPLPPAPSDPINRPPSHSEPSPTTSDSASSIDIGKRSFLGRRKLPKLMGVQFATISFLILQFLLLAGTIVGWVFAAISIHNTSNEATPTPQGVFNDQSPNEPGSGSSDVFVHAAFTVVVIVQLVFIERRIFRIRAERYAFKHPGEMLPTSRRRGFPTANPAMPMAPWSRPSLPTYAAALVAGGYGTGDVEDAEIAQPPPPAYGKTRGSTLLLAGYLRDSLRMQVREQQDRRVSTISERSDRPISFLSRDEEWEERRDADRVRRIDEALAVLEDGQPRSRASTVRPVSAGP